MGALYQYGDYIIYDEGRLFSAREMDFYGTEVRVDCEVTFYDENGDEDTLINYDIRASTAEMLLQLGPRWNEKEYEIENGECIDVSYSVFNQFCFGICTMHD